LIESLNKKQWTASFSEKLKQKLSKINDNKNKSLEETSKFVLKENPKNVWEEKSKDVLERKQLNFGEKPFNVLEEKCCHIYETVGKLAEDFLLIKHNEGKKIFKDAVWSLIVQHNLMIKVNSMKQNPNHTNPIVENEISNQKGKNLGVALPGSFSNIKGLSESDVLFRDNIDDSQFFFVKDSLEQSHIVLHVLHPKQSNLKNCGSIYDLIEILKPELSAENIFRNFI